MERSNQPPAAKCCRSEGQADLPLEGKSERTTVRKLTQANSSAASASRTALKQFSLDTNLTADGDGVDIPTPNTTATVKGEVAGDLPGSKSVADEEETSRNLGRPPIPRRSNYENQPGSPTQPKEDQATGEEGIRSAHSSPGPSAGWGPGQGADITTQPAQATRAVRTTEPHGRTFLRAITNKATQDKRHRFGGLYRLLNQAYLRDSFYRLRKQAAPGEDKVTFQDYEKNLEQNLIALVQRLKQKSYRAKLVKRQYIPKDNGKLRPLGIPALEDKLLQRAVADILSAIYEADFLPISYGYRPEREALDAVRELTGTLQKGRYQFVVEADIKGFFDHIQHDWLLKMLEQRINDGALLNLINKWLKAGILEPDGQVEHPQSGTPQGGIISPVLANVYLHYALDLWFERRIRKSNRGKCELFRFADDFVACFEYRHEAEAFERALQERLQKFGLEVAPEKTKTLRFGRGDGSFNGRFDFLGFEFRWELSRQGRPTVKRRTSRKKLRASVARFTEWIKTHRHHRVNELMQTLVRKYRGYWNYYGVIGNSKSMAQFYYESSRILHKWLNRRSQKRSYTWRAFGRLLKRYRIPSPRIVEKANRESPCRGGQSLLAALQQVNLYGDHYRQAST